MEDKVLEVPQFIPSVHKSTKQYGFSFCLQCSQSVE